MLIPQLYNDAVGICEHPDICLMLGARCYSLIVQHVSIFLLSSFVVSPTSIVRNIRPVVLLN